MELKSWLTAGVLGLGIIVGFPTSCAMYSNYKIAEMVAGGASPTEAACAINTERKSTVCLTAGLLKNSK